MENLFFLFDSVHLLKCIRNNWLGLSDSAKTFIFQDVSNEGTRKASLSHVRQLHESEKDSIVKLAPSLTQKALYPSNIERQNVKLVLQMFDEKVSVALNHIGQHSGRDVSGTQAFIDLIIKLWEILNVKSTSKGFRKRDVDSNPIYKVDDKRISFLNDVHNWLCKWENFSQKAREGRLTNETLVALKHTVNTFVHLVPYLLNEMHLLFILTGKFQTDCLEA